LVPFSDSEAVVEALKKNGVEHQFLVADKEGHGFFYRKGEEGYEKCISPAIVWLKKYFSK